MTAVEITGGAATSGESTSRAAARERELQKRAALLQHVASSKFDGRAVTDFYGFGKVLGQGSFGKVRLAWHRLAGHKVAIKSYDKSKLREPQHWKRVQQEIKLMERLNHPHVIQMLEMIDSTSRVHIVMEHAGGGNLCTFVKNRKRLTEPEARKIFVQLLLAVEYMHDAGIIHRDIKLENVLFDDAGNMKLVDFGFSVACRDPSKRLKIFCGTPSYMAPEIVKRQEYLGRPVDVWSLGVLLYACLVGSFPFTAKTYPDLYRKIKEARIHFPDHVSHAARDLIHRMMQPDVGKRLTLAQARSHPWAVPAVAPARLAVAHPADKALYISEDPSNDLYESALKKMEELGFKRELVVNSVLSRAKNAYTASYYLLLARYGREGLGASAAASKSLTGPEAGHSLGAATAAGDPRAPAASSAGGSSGHDARRLVRPASAAPDRAHVHGASRARPASANRSGQRTGWRGLHGSDSDSVKQSSYRGTQHSSGNTWASQASSRQSGLSYSRPSSAAPRESGAGRFSDTAALVAGGGRNRADFAHIAQRYADGGFAGGAKHAAYFQRPSSAYTGTR